MKIVVIGAGGYIARNLILKLSIQHEVFRFVKSSSWSSHVNNNLFETKDLTQVRDNIKNLKPEIVINLASSYSAQHNYENIKNILDTEISLSVHLAEICGELGIYYIQTKSLFQKSTLESAINLYAASKNARDEIIKYYVNYYNLKLINIVLGDVYGPNDNREKLIPNVIKHLKSESNSNFNLDNPERKFYPVYLDDVTWIIDTIISGVKNKEIQPGNFRCFPADGMSLGEFVYKVQNIVSKSKFQITWLNKREDFRETELMIPKEMNCPLNKFTPFEVGFQAVLKIADVK